MCARCRRLMIPPLKPMITAEECRVLDEYRGEDHLTPGIMAIRRRLGTKPGGPNIFTPFVRPRRRPSQSIGA